MKPLVADLTLHDGIGELSAFAGVAIAVLRVELVRRVPGEILERVWKRLSRHLDEEAGSCFLALYRDKKTLLAQVRSFTPAWPGSTVPVQ